MCSSGYSALKILLGVRGTSLLQFFILSDKEKKNFKDSLLALWTADMAFSLSPACGSGEREKICTAAAQWRLAPLRGVSSQRSGGLFPQYCVSNDMQNTVKRTQAGPGKTVKP